MTLLYGASGCSQIKQGEVHEAVSIAMGLVSSGQPLEVQHFGYQLLQALVRLPQAGRMHRTSIALCNIWCGHLARSAFTCIEVEACSPGPPGDVTLGEIYR